MDRMKQERLKMNATNTTATAAQAAEIEKAVREFARLLGNCFHTLREGLDTRSQPVDDVGSRNVTYISVR